jgi:hypothetical protein
VFSRAGVRMQVIFGLALGSEVRGDVGAQVARFFVC